MEDIGSSIKETVEDCLEMLPYFNSNLGSVKITVTIEPDSDSGYINKNIDKIYFQDFHLPKKKIALVCPLCLNKRTNLVFDINETLPVCSGCLEGEK